MGFEGFPAFQIPVFAGFEITEPEGHRPGCHGGADFPEPVSQGIHHFFRMAGLDQIQGMFMDVGGPDEFFPHEPMPSQGRLLYFSARAGSPRFM